MVGFGSSLRIARRPGWEGAYLDYETLKLLLSQIEAVYEEEGHRRRRSNSVFGTSETDGEQKKETPRDYREELFLESDSNQAFLSVDDSNDEDGLSSDGSIEDSSNAIKVHHVKMHNAGNDPRVQQPFRLSYSKEASSSDEEGKNSGCGAGVSYSFSSWAAWDKASSSLADGADKKSKKRKTNMDTSALEDEDAFYITNKNMKGHDTFFMTGASATIDEESQMRSNVKYSFMNAPVTSARETSSLLPPTTPAQSAGSALYTFSSGQSAGNPDSLTPPVTMYSSTATDSSDPTNSPPVLPSSKLEKEQQATHRRLIQERMRERKKRRMRRQRRKAIRRQKEKKIPRHLRVAHSKARAITERFLGLLRAETEKVMLFAQSRLGELADTAGSLRFSNIDDFDSGGANQKNNRPGSTFDYPLSDAGLHPSASSSEDEGVAAGQGTWTDSSDEEDEESLEQQASIPQAFAVSGVGDNVPGEETKSHEKPASRKTTRKKASRSSARALISNESREEDYANAVVRRQIAHFTELRKRRPIFLRNDQILGEDMLLISAVEEVDGYTAVAVELAHVLRYICVNLIAVRKIAAKHDRLLMQRMLGGFYNRRYAHLEDAYTLGGLIARNSGDIYEAHPALIGNMSQYKLVGLYDKKIQKLANSRTVQVISSCLALALSEYEVARSRADALTKLNSGAATPKRSGGHEFNENKKEGILLAINSDDEGEGPPSTTSSISLTRLRFSVTTVFAMREASRYKTQHFQTYLSRSLLSFTGRPVIGEGLDGCSRATLDFFVDFNCDAALLLQTDVLYSGLRRCRWMKESLADLMISSLAVGASVPPSKSSDDLVFGDLKNVISSINISPDSRTADIKRFLRASGGEPINYYYPELPPIALQLNAMGCFLYMMNYYVAHSTTNSFVESTGASYAYASLVIGAPNFSALCLALIHSVVVTGEHSTHSRTSVDVPLIKWFLILAGIAGLLGNIIHGLAVDRESLGLAVLGRFIIGFSSGEILHRQLVQAFLPSQVVPAAARVVQYRVYGTLAGLILGMVAEMVPLTISSIGVRSMQSTSWVMAILWIIYVFRLLVQFRPQTTLLLLEKPLRQASAPEQTEKIVMDEYDYASSDSEHIGTPRSFWTTSKKSEDIPYAEANRNFISSKEDTETTPLKLSTSKESRKRGTRNARTFMTRLRKLLSYHVAIPTLLFTIFYVNFAMEMFFTGTPLATRHYFEWSGSRAGAMLALLVVMVLPLNLFCERIARRYEERTILKRAILFVSLGTFVLINWTSMFSLAQRVPNLLSEVEGGKTHSYDWSFGVFQYFFGAMISFAALTAVEGATLSLLSKLAPLRLRGIVLHLGTVVVVLGFIAKILADLQLMSVVLSHRIISTDVINTVAIPLFLFSFPILHLIRKHFFYLM